MAQSYFVWNGVDCRSMGITLSGPVPIVRPEERVKHIEIPGRAGDLTETEGENIFNSYIQTVGLIVCGGFHVRDVYKWLRGAGEVTVSGEPDRKQKARIIGAITLNKHSRNLDYWEGECQFYCQPLKERLYDPEQQVANSGATVRNDGDVEARPRWRIKTKTGLGASETVTLTAGGKTITLTGAEAAKWYLIDSDTMMVTNWDLQTTQSNYTSLSSGEFPALAVGANTVTFTNASEVHVIRRERFL